MRTMKRTIRNCSIQTRLLALFIGSMLIILCVNSFILLNVNRIVAQLDKIYTTNINLNQLSDVLSDTQNAMTDYLNTKSTDAMGQYYKSVNEYNQLLEGMNDTICANELKVLERNIKHMSENYIEMTGVTIEAKRGRDIEKYKSMYNKAKELANYIEDNIATLNNKQFRSNTKGYNLLSSSLNYLELLTVLILTTVAICSTSLIYLVTKSITNPLKKLVQVANRVGAGNFDGDLIEHPSKDEVGVVANAFNKMVISIRAYIERIKENMETEQALKEKELVMENLLKDAKLKYLQAQINPHFLFNTLNAGIQLAMMEEADKTYEYMQKLAEFFRYNMRKNNEVVTLEEEVKSIETYIYILNVRFCGEIHYETKMDESVETILSTVKIPGMILQPIVENSINYGIRGIDWDGIILLSIYEEENRICIRIRDNGIGMEQEKIDRIMSASLTAEEIKESSNGIGLNNVINRLKLFYQCEDIILITSEGKNKGTEVLICLPQKEENQSHV